MGAIVPSLNKAVFLETAEVRWFSTIINIEFYSLPHYINPYHTDFS